MLKFFGRSPLDAAAVQQMQRDLQLVRGYWQALRHGPQLPHRSDLDPRGFVGVLDRVFLIERVAKGFGRFRLAGMHLHDVLGMDARGMVLGSLFDAQGRERMSAALEAVFDATTIVEVQLEAERSIGKPALSGRMLLLPVLNDSGAQPLALGCLTTHDAVGRAPRRFAIAGLSREAVVGPGIALASKTVVPDLVDVSRGRPALRLVSSRD
ncbi:MAG: PAS domain-containing protein [Cypionkella sp.]